MLRLMRLARDAIIQDRYPAFLREFFGKLYSEGRYPSWAVDALKGVGVDLLAP